MTKYQRKQPQFEAIQWFKDGDHPDVRPCNRNSYLWLSRLSPDLGDVVGSESMGLCGQLDEESLVRPGNYIVTGVDGEIYPVKAEIFEKTYSIVDEKSQGLSSPFLRHSVSRNWSGREGNPMGGYIHGIGFSIVWQDGPLKDHPDPLSTLLNGVNGAFVEDIINACCDRLQFFQDSRFGSEYNQAAIAHLKLALQSLESRTKDRESRGVEGTNQL